MGRIQRAVRRALNPISTSLTTLVQGALLGRGLGFRRGARLARGVSSYSSPAAGLAALAVVRRGRRAGGSLRPTAGLGPGQVVVPDVVGLLGEQAQAVLLGVQLIAVGPDPAPAAAGWAEGVVVAQWPDPGAMLDRGSTVTLWIEHGPGSAGVREPRRPRPKPRTAAAMVDEEYGEAVG